MYEKLLYVIKRELYISSTNSEYGKFNGYHDIYYYLFESECKDRRIEVHTNFQLDSYSKFAKSVDGKYYNAYINPWLNGANVISEKYRVDSFTRIECPHCNQYFELEDALTEYFVTCKYCLKTTINTFITSEENYVMEIFDKTSKFAIVQFIREIGKRIDQLSSITEDDRESIMTLLLETELKISYKKLKKMFDKSK